MPVKYEWIDVDIVLSTAESLKKAAEQLTVVAAGMQQGNLKKALFPWTQRQWNCHDVIVTMAAQCVAVLDTQVLAKKQNRASPYELMQVKSRRDVAARKARIEADGGPANPPPKRGRPRKK